MDPGRESLLIPTLMKTLAQEQSRAEILRRLRTMRPERAARWGQMSASQMICHVSDCCRMAIGEKPVSDASGVLQRTFVKWMALYAPLRWPTGFRTRPEIDQQCTGTRPSEFAADVAALELLLERMTTHGADWPPHPVFGRMSRAAWLRWGYLHTDHHLRQFGA